MDFLTTRQVADVTGASIKTVHRWVEAGKLRSVAKLDGIRGARLFDPDEVARFVAERDAENGAA